MGSALPPVTVSPCPSRRFTLILRGLQLITGAVLVFAPIPLPVKICLVSGLLLHAVVSYRRQHGRSSALPQQVRLDDEHGVRLLHTDGRVIKTRLRAGTVITPFALLLRFEGTGWWADSSLLLWADSLSADELRRLRVLLRFGGSAPERSQ